MQFFLILHRNQKPHPVNDLKVVTIQTALEWENPEVNLRNFDRIIRAIRSDPDLILLPEMFNTGFSVNPEKVGEAMDGPSVAFLKQWADLTGAMVMGSLLIKTGGSVFNRLVAAGPKGTLYYYDKRHLFRLSEEFRLISQGRERRVIRFRGWNILLQVCYDLRFPVWSKNRYDADGYEYDLMVYVANWPATRSDVWHTLLKARAIENQSYVAGVNRIGVDGFGAQHTGESMVLDPRGKTITLSAMNEEVVSSVVLNRNDLQVFRDSFTVGMDWDTFTINP